MYCVKHFQTYAHNVLGKGTRELYYSGADGQQTLGDNVQAFSRYRIRPRVLRDISKPIDTRVQLLGEWVDSPIGIAPTAVHKLAHQDGEAATAKASKNASSCMVVSTWTTTSLENIAKANEPGGLRWFYLDVFSDEEFNQSVINEVESLGFKGIALTVDLAEYGNKIALKKNNMRFPEHVQFELFTGDSSFAKSVLEITKLPNPATKVRRIRKYHQTWDMIDDIRKMTKLPIIVKGILTAEDALIAVARGVQAIIVSNHGGRQLDGVPATIDSLHEVVKAVAGRVEVYMDGGIREGTDILKALAMGAKAVFVGRPILWGLAYDGHKGVERVLEILKEELVCAMKLSGCAKLSDISSSLVVHESYYTTLPRPKL